MWLWISRRYEPALTFRKSKELSARSGACRTCAVVVRDATVVGGREAGLASAGALGTIMRRRVHSARGRMRERRSGKCILEEVVLGTGVECRLVLVVVENVRNSYVSEV